MASVSLMSVTSMEKDIDDDGKDENKATRVRPLRQAKIQFGAMTVWRPTMFPEKSLRASDLYWQAKRVKRYGFYLTR
jgi:hypothetical protein